jgi:tetratricopeptide (TPR) repeat protein
VLEKMTAAPDADPFAWYGLALEYRSLGRLEDCLRTFETLRQRDASYVPMYLMAAQVLAQLGRNEEARTWAQQGTEQARRKGDTHALGELESLLAGL